MSSLYSDYKWGEYWTPPQEDGAPIPSDVVYDYDEGRYRHCLNLEEIRAKQNQEAPIRKQEWMDWYNHDRRLKEIAKHLYALTWLADTHIQNKQTEDKGGLV
jgi:hypothetical protein